MLTIAASLVWLSAATGQQPAEPSYETVKFQSLDGLEITADLYAGNDARNPFIVMCHQAGWSRGEYREIAPKLQKAGFNCLAIDQRSGKKDLYNKVNNETVRAAAQAGKGTEFTDAEQDIVAALKWARTKQAKGKVILWGSSYSAALSLRIAGERPELVDGVLAFAPGEYFERFSKPGNWIESSAKKIKAPAFVTSAKEEYASWQKIFNAIPGQQKIKFVPTTKGNHGSRALYKRFDDSESYWQAVAGFLQKYSGAETSGSPAGK
jgi:dienelactone hydrolase